jgi:hypothetical protein
MPTPSVRRKRTSRGGCGTSEQPSEDRRSVRLPASSSQLSSRRGRRRRRQGGQTLAEKRPGRRRRSDPRGETRKLGSGEVEFITVHTRRCQCAYRYCCCFHCALPAVLATVTPPRRPLRTHSSCPPVPSSTVRTEVRHLVGKGLLAGPPSRPPMFLIRCRWTAIRSTHASAIIPKGVEFWLAAEGEVSTRRRLRGMFTSNAL